MFNNRRGAALVLALVSTAVIAAMSSSYVMRAVQEKNLLEREVRSARALYAAEAGVQAGLYGLRTLINTHMLNTVNATAPSVIASNANTYVTSGNGLALLLNYVRDDDTYLLTSVDGASVSPAVSPAVAQAVYAGSDTDVDDGSYRYTIRIWQKSSPTTAGTNVWDFPYYFKIESTGSNLSLVDKKTVQGDFTVRVQKDNFARYALFTNAQTLSDGTTNVWFTNNTIFSGPVFTNDRFNFAYNPSGVFYDTIRQAQTTARFYNNNNPILRDADVNGTIDVPVFSEGFDRRMTTVTMPTTTVETDMAKQAAGVSGGASIPYTTSGIYIPSSGGQLTGGIYVRGDTAVSLSVDGSNRQVVTVTSGGVTKTVTMDHATHQTTVQTGAGTPVTYSGVPDGAGDVGPIMYVYGRITSLSGTVQRDTQMTIASSNDLSISNNIVYQDYTAAVGTPGGAGYVPPTADGANNLLGLLSWNGNVRLSNSTPSNVNIHATVMSRNGVVQVDDYSSIAVKGKATILGGVISNNYGAFGTFQSSTGAAVSGYGRNFVYDTRMETSLNPPYFPTLNTFIAFTDDIMDKITWQQGGF